MTTKNATRKLFVNVSVKNLARSMEFFKKLGFAFNAQFTDQNAACMVVNEDAFFMLLTEPFFKGFTKRAVSDTTQQTEALYAISCGSRAEVDELAKIAADAGAKPAMDPQDHGFMYSRSFYDLDDHHWEVIWMDPAAVQPQ